MAAITRLTPLTDRGRELLDQLEERTQVTPSEIDEASGARTYYLASERAEGDDGGVLGPEARGVDLDLAPRRDRPHGRVSEPEPSIVGVVERMQPARAMGPRRLMGIVGSAGEAAGAVDHGLPRRRRRER